MHAERMPAPTLSLAPASVSGYQCQRLGRYEVLTRIGQGGMATVYVARVHGVGGFERLVALKVLHPQYAQEREFISMFLDEARVAARIHHPNVVSTLDVHASDEEGYYLVMEYVEGDHLGALLQSMAKKRRRLPVAITLRVILDTLNGLDAAHRLKDDSGRPLKLVHRDVSPHNILVGADGVSRLTDFGVSKAEVRLAATKVGQFKGKLAYMAPEQIANNDADQRADLFSMGVVLWETLTSKRLFRAKSSAATLNNVLKSEVLPPSRVCADAAPFDDLVLKALHRNPDKRFQYAEEFIEAIEGIALQHGIPIARTRQVAATIQPFIHDKLEEENERIQVGLNFFRNMDAEDENDASDEQAPVIGVQADPEQVKTTLFRPADFGVSRSAPDEVISLPPALSLPPESSFLVSIPPEADKSASGSSLVSTSGSISASGRVSSSPRVLNHLSSRSPRASLRPGMTLSTDQMSGSPTSKSAKKQRKPTVWVLLGITLTIGAALSWYISRGQTASENIQLNTDPATHTDPGSTKLQAEDARHPKQQDAAEVTAQAPTEAKIEIDVAKEASDEKAAEGETKVLDTVVIKSTDLDPKEVKKDSSQEVSPSDHTDQKKSSVKRTSTKKEASARRKRRSRASTKSTPKATSTKTSKKVKKKEAPLLDNPYR